MDLRCSPNILCNLSHVIITCKKDFTKQWPNFANFQDCFPKLLDFFNIGGSSHFFSFMSGLQQIWINFLLDDRQFGYITKQRIKILNLDINEFCGLKILEIFSTFLGLLLEFTLDFFLNPFFSERERERERKFTGKHYNHGSLCTMAFQLNLTM